MMMMLKGLFSALLEFLYGLSTKNVEAKNADPTAGGVKHKFIDRVREYRDSCSSENTSTNCGTGGNQSVCCSEGRNKDQVSKQGEA